MADPSAESFGMGGRGFPGGLVYDEPAGATTAPPPAAPAAPPPEPVAPEPVAPEPVAPEAPAYDPANHTVPEVVEHALGLEFPEIAELRELEAAGKARSTLLAELDQLLS